MGGWLGGWVAGWLGGWAVAGGGRLRFRLPGRPSRRAAARPAAAQHIPVVETSIGVYECSRGRCLRQRW